MKVGIYTVFDRVAGASQVFTAPDDKVAIRSLKNHVADEVKKGTGFLTSNSDDLVLKRLGYLEIGTGEIEADSKELQEVYDIVKNYNLNLLGEKKDE